VIITFDTRPHEPAVPPRRGRLGAGDLGPVSLSGFVDGSRGRLGLWEQFEGRGVSGTHHGEVVVVEGGDLVDVEPLGRSHH